MPFYIQSDSPLSSFPKECPFCNLRNVDAWYKQTFSKMRLGKFPGSLVSEVIQPFLPACSECVSWFKWTRFFLFLFGFSALLGPFVIVGIMFTFGYGAHVDFAFAVWFGLILGWAWLWVWRRIKGNKLKLAYFSRKQLIYSSSEEHYMQELARLNHLRYEHKPFLMKLS